MKITKLILIQFILSLSFAAYSQGYLESPVSGTTESGIGMIRGWRCNVKKIEAVVDGKAAGTTPVGETRPGTESYCGTMDTGYSLLVNFNGYSIGSHNLKVYGDGTLIGEVNFNTVQSGGEDYLKNASKQTTISDFPSTGKTATLTWSEARQNFVVTAISSTTAPGTPVTETCSSANFTTARYNAVAIGMTYDQVNAVMGCKNDSRFTQRYDTHLVYGWVADTLFQQVLVYFDVSGSVVTPLGSDRYYKSSHGF